MVSNGKISLRQAMLIFLLIAFTPSVRIIPQYTAGIAKQAAWLAPIVSFLLILPIISALNSILNKYPDKSFTGILEVIFGRLIGKIVIFTYIVLFMMLLDVNVNGIGRKLTSSMYTTVNPALFIIAMLVIVGFAVYKGGFTVIARMGELALPFLVLIFMILCALAGQNIKLNRLTPISTLDIIPVLKSSLAVSAVQAHLPMLFLLSDYINNRDKIGKLCTTAALMHMLLLIILLVAVIGSLSAETAANTPLSFLATVKLISLFQSIERIEPFVVGLWIFTDFMFDVVLLILLLNMYRSFFNLSKTNNFIIINLIIIFFLAMILGRNMFEIRRFIEAVILPVSAFWGYVLPLIVFITGKIRKLL